MSNYLPSSKEMKNTAALGGGVLLGGYVSPSITGAITDVIKPKTDNVKGIVLAVLSVASGFGAAYIKGNGIGETVGKGFLVGISGASGVEAINTFAKKSTAVQTTAAKTTPIGKAVARMTGLGCPCQNPQPAVAEFQLNARRRRRGMGMYVPSENPAFAQLGTPATASESLSESINRGRMLAA